MSAPTLPDSVALIARMLGTPTPRLGALEFIGTAITDGAKELATSIDGHGEAIRELATALERLAVRMEGGSTDDD